MMSIVCSKHVESCK